MFSDNLRSNSVPRALYSLPTASDVSPSFKIFGLVLFDELFPQVKYEACSYLLGACVERKFFTAIVAICPSMDDSAMQYLQFSSKTGSCFFRAAKNLTLVTLVTSNFQKKILWCQHRKFSQTVCQIVSAQ